MEPTTARTLLQAQKESAYGKILIQYRRGLISHDEMLAACDKCEKELNPNSLKNKELQHFLWGKFVIA